MEKYRVVRYFEDFFADTGCILQRHIIGKFLFWKYDYWIERERDSLGSNDISWANHYKCKVYNSSMEEIYDGKIKKYCDED